MAPDSTMQLVIICARIDEYNASRTIMLCTQLVTTLVVGETEFKALCKHLHGILRWIEVHALCSLKLTPSHS